MSENEKRAERAFRQTCAYLDKRGWKYDKDEEELSIRTAVRGEDIPIPMNLRVNVEMQILQMLSTMPFEIHMLKPHVERIFAEHPVHGEDEHIADTLLCKLSGVQGISHSYLSENSLYHEFIMV